MQFTGLKWTEEESKGLRETGTNQREADAGVMENAGGGNWAGRENGREEKKGINRMEHYTGKTIQNKNKE